MDFAPSPRKAGLDEERTARRVLVTGGSSGLGAALAAAFLALGDDVLIADINKPESGASDQSVPHSQPHFIKLDVRSDADWAAAREWVEREWGGLDVLVNNAGVAGGGRIDVAGMDEWHWITEINLFGLVRGTRTFVPMFKQQRSGHVVNIASLAGLVHPAGMGSYNAVKAGVVAFSETTGHELAEWGVRCSVVCPSYFRTRLIENMQGNDTAVGQVIGDLVARAPLGPEDIAAAVLEGIERGDELIIPDDAAREAYDLKLTDRAAYDRVMRKQAQRLNAMSEGGRE